MGSMWETEVKGQKEGGGRGGGSMEQKSVDGKRNTSRLVLICVNW